MSFGFLMYVKELFTNFQINCFDTPSNRLAVCLTKATSRKIRMNYYAILVCVLSTNSDAWSLHFYASDRFSVFLFTRLSLNGRRLNCVFSSVFLFLFFIPSFISSRAHLCLCQMNAIFTVMVISVHIICIHKWCRWWWYSLGHAYQQLCLSFAHAHMKLKQRKSKC